MGKIWQVFWGNSPLVATAIHDGHRLRPEIANIMKLSAQDRLREEDPFTAEWTTIAENRIIGTHSRFEVDLNRPREKAVYIQPDDAWGLDIWTKTLSKEIVEGSLVNYDAFYAEAHQLFTDLTHQFGRFVVYDLHSYNHRREGPDGSNADPQENPEVNLGTGTMNREKWATIIEQFINDLSQFDYLGRHLDVRENIKFRGGNFGRWVHENFPQSACVLSIEFKKFFMDEWTGVPDPMQLEAIQLGLQATTSGVLDVLKRM